MRLLCFFAAVSAFAQTPPFPISDAKAIAEGKDIFRLNCSVGYCHGVDGKAGRGPRIQGRPFERSYLYKVTRDGIPRSSMPGWKDRLKDEEIWSVVAYMLSISTPMPETQSVAPEAATTAGATVQKKSDGPAYGESAKGKAIFFDSASDLQCGGCHTGEANAAGPPLANIKNRPAHEILRDIVAPGARYNAQYKVVKVTLKSGQSFEAIRGVETPASVKFHDITGLPPVLRNVDRADIASEAPQDRSPMPAKYGETYTFQQLAHLVAYLKDQDLAIADLLP